MTEPNERERELALECARVWTRDSRDVDLAACIEPFLAAYRAELSAELLKPENVLREFDRLSREREVLEVVFFPSTVRVKRQLDPIDYECADTAEAYGMLAAAIERGDHLQAKPAARQVMGTETCPLSAGHPYGKGATLGYHVVGADRCCCFCGSWHPDEFEAWCRKILDGADRAAWVYESPVLSGLATTALSLNDRRDKLYVRRAGISNASEGAIKVKVAHLSKEQIDLANETLRFCREQAAALVQSGKGE